RSQGVDVGGPSRRVGGAELFGGHAQGGAHVGTDHGEVTTGFTDGHEPEVDHLGPGGAQHDVGGFEVAVQQTCLVDGFEGVGEQEEQAGPGDLFQSSVAFDVFGQVQAGDVLHGQPRAICVGFAGTHE